MSVTSFTATNLDDLFLLMLFFGQRRAGFRAGHIVAGQFLGFAALVVISLSGFLLQGRFPEQWVGLLGLLPVSIGALRLWRLRKPPEPDYTPKRPISNVGAVAAITMANGADNIAIYTPLFATVDGQGTMTVLVVFAAMLALWCCLGAMLAKFPGFQSKLNRYGHVVMPLILIGLGVYILLKSGSHELPFSFPRDAPSQLSARTNHRNSPRHPSANIFAPMRHSAS